MSTRPIPQRRVILYTTPRSKIGSTAEILLRFLRIPHEVELQGYEPHLPETLIDAPPHGTTRVRRHGEMITYILSEFDTKNDLSTAGTRTGFEAKADILRFLDHLASLPPEGWDILLGDLEQKLRASSAGFIRDEKLTIADLAAFPYIAEYVTPVAAARNRKPVYPEVSDWFNRVKGVFSIQVAMVLMEFDDVSWFGRFVV
ncbi:hypothetical protein BJX61DRAFT_374553 [Aspergillus egyptiacus]|nr:hypothetical protein BJX61DRAFT_374553 [Aspergillus egyptiacus]